MARMLPNAFQEPTSQSVRGPFRSKISGFALLAIVAVVGCSNPVSKMLFTNHKQRNPAMGPEKQRERTEEQEHRAKYRSTGSSTDLEWLMKNRIENGLTVNSVNNILGEKGDLIEGAEGIAQAGGETGSTDGTYMYGPDDRGRMYHLTFKNSRLVDFNPTIAMDAKGGIARTSLAKKSVGSATLDDDMTKSSLKKTASVD